MNQEQRKELDETIAMILLTNQVDEMDLKKVINLLNIQLAQYNKHLEIIERPLVAPEPQGDDPMEAYDAWEENNYALQLEERACGGHNPVHKNLMKKEP